MRSRSSFVQPRMDSLSLTPDRATLALRSSSPTAASWISWIKPSHDEHAKTLLKFSVFRCIVDLAFEWSGPEGESGHSSTTRSLWNLGHAADSRAVPGR